MARSFTKNLSNYLSLGTAQLIGGVNGASAISLAGWVNVSSFTGAVTFCNDVLGFTFTSQTACAVLLFDTTSGNKVKAFARSNSTDTGQTAIGTTSLSTGTWYHVGMVVDYANAKIRVYTNGSQEANTTVTFGNTTLTDGSSPSSNGNDGIGVALAAGVPASTTRQMAGGIAEVGLWKGDIGDNGMKALALGRLPYTVLPSALKNYWPLWGLGSKEPDLFGLARNGTITGTIAPANHAPVTTFTRKRSKVGTPSTALTSRILQPLVITPPIPAAALD